MPRRTHWPGPTIKVRSAPSSFRCSLGHPRRLFFSARVAVVTLSMGGFLTVVACDFSRLCLRASIKLITFPTFTSWATTGAPAILVLMTSMSASR
jgi:hypothetical protein